MMGVTLRAVSRIKELLCVAFGLGLVLAPARVAGVLLVAVRLVVRQFGLSKSATGSNALY